MRCWASTYEMTHTGHFLDKETYRFVREPSLGHGRDSQQNL